MNPKRYRKLSEIRRHASYTRIYYDLVAVLSQEVTWLAMVTGILTILAALLFTTDTSNLDQLDFLLVPVIIVGSVILLAFIGLLVYIADAYSKNPVSEVPFMAVYIMTAIPRPYTEQRGLGYKQIKHLVEIAKIEQSASDWRGSFVSVIIVGVLTLVIALSPFAWQFALTSMLNPLPEGATTPWSDSWLSRPMESEWYVLITSFGLIIIVIWLIVTLFGNARRFLGTEPANRILLMACEDALAFMEAHELTNNQAFTFREKKAIAAHFRCRIVAEEEATTYDKIGMWSDEPSGLIWYIHPPVEYSRLEKLRYYTRKVRDQITRTGNS